MFCLNRNRLVLQFHITGRCNLRCKHCYREEGDVQPLSYDDVIRVIDQFLTLCRQYNRQKGIKKRGHINLTGGEPFIREDIGEILAYLGQKRDQVTYGILSNGSFLDASRIALLKETGVSFVQLSIDGNRKTHDSLRAPGDYHRVLETARLLEASGIRTYISFTANRQNFRQLPAVAAACRRRRISRLWSDRLVPIGNGQAMADLQITEKQLPAYLRAFKRARGSALTRKLWPKTRVTMSRALQFLDTGDSVYRCSAGDSLITVDEFGHIMPCRRMPILCGDIFTNTLASVYEDHPVFRDLRKPLIPEECAACPHSVFCGGGARCQSYATYGTYRQADPACFLKARRISK